MVSSVGKGQNQLTVETRGYNVKELFHFIDWYQQLPEDPLLKRIVKVTNLGAMSLFSNAAELQSIFFFFWFIQDPRLTVEQLQMGMYNPDTQEVVPERTASLANWIKVTEKSVYFERKEPVKAK